MEQVLIYMTLVVIGLAMGSFAGAMIWRLRAHQLKWEKKNGEKVDHTEYKMLGPLTRSALTKDRSRCLHCGHVLKWYDLIPLVSWVSNRGKCRYCHTFIGWFEPLIEVSVAALFVISFIYWPDPITSVSALMVFGLWLIACVLLVILFVYDLKWFLLPNHIVFPLIGVAGVVALLRLLTSATPGEMAFSLLISIFILSGVYLMLWLASKGQWIGFGDVKLGLALALMLGQWQLAFVALFLANIIGCLIVLPALLSGKMTRKTRVPLGPLLILGGVIAMLCGHTIVNWYFMAFI